MNVTPGYTFTGVSDPITYSKLNLLGQPSVAIGTNEVVLANLATLAGPNYLLGRYSSSSGNVQAIDLTTQGLGFYTGAGGTVTQASSKSTTVVLSKMTGIITLDAANLGSDTTVSFTLTNTLIAATDLLNLNHISGGTAGSYLLNAQCAAGSAVINVRNITGGALAEAIVLRFAVFKSVNA